MKTIEVYTTAELKDKYPDVFENALEKWNDTNMDFIPWSDEIVESMKAVIAAAGLRIADYNLGPYDNFLSIHDFDAEGLTGQRAIAWLENNLLNNLRTPYGLKNIDKRVKYGYKAGSIPSCPFTGYYADEDMLEGLYNEIMDGSTLGEAFTRLGYVVSKLLEGELEYQQSEECFIEQDHLLYTLEGRAI